MEYNRQTIANLLKSSHLQVNITSSSKFAIIQKVNQAVSSTEGSPITVADVGKSNVALSTGVSKAGISAT